MKADPTQTHVTREYKHDSPLICCRFDPTGRFVFASAEDRSVLRWNLASESGDKIQMLGHDSWVRDFAFAKEGSVVVSAGYDDTLIWWPVEGEKPEPIRELKAHKGWIRTVAVSPDGSLLASAGNDRVVKLWKMEDGSPVRQFEGHERDVYSSLFHPDGEFLLTGDLKGTIHQWEVATGKRVRTFDAKALNTYNGGQQVDYGGVRGLTVSPDRKHLACAGLHKATNPLGAISQPLYLRFDWESGELLKSHVADGVEGIGWRAFFHPEGFLLGCAGGKSGGFLLFWNGEEDQVFHTFKLPNILRDGDLHPDGIQVASAHFDKTLRISRMTAKDEKKT